MASFAAGARLRRRRSPKSAFNFVLQAICVIYLGIIVVGIVAYKGAFLDVVFADPFFGVYSIVVCVFILSRFAFSLFYHSHPDAGIQPSVAIVMPAFNEEAAIVNSVRSLLAVNYPQELLELVVVNDGSTDGTSRGDRLGGSGRAAGARDRVPREPRQARRDGGRDPRDQRRGRRVRRLRQRARPKGRSQPGAGLRRGEGGSDRRPRRRPELPRVLDRAYAGGALLRRLPGVQGGRVGIRRGDLLLGMLLGLPAQRDPAVARPMGEPVVPREAGDIRRRPVTDELRAARLERDV